MLAFSERGKPEYPEKNLLKQSRELHKLHPLMTAGQEIEHRYDFAFSICNPWSGLEWLQTTEKRPAC